MRSLPMLPGEGAHPPADACDFARFCSALDFWSINDHAEAISPQHWQETKDSIRQCNAVAGDPQTRRRRLSRLGMDAGRADAEDHYGHKNVIFRDPTRTRCRRGRSARSARSWSARCASPRRSGSASSFRSSTGRTASATSTSASTSRSSRDEPMCPEASTRASCRRTATSRRRPRRRCSRSCRSGDSTPGHPARHDVGPLHAARQHWDKQLTAAQQDPAEADADRGLFRPRQLRGVPRLARGDLRRRAARRPVRRRRPSTCPAAGRRAR